MKMPLSIPAAVFRFLLRFSGFALAIFGAGCSWAGYLGQAGCGQASILWRRQPIEQALRDDALTAQEREALQFVQEVRRFAIDRMHLKAGETYTQYSRLDRESLAWNVTAAPALSLTPLTWWFPIVGDVPYLGYFDRADAEAKQAELVAAGYDTELSEVSGYSTLGWFDDPLTSPQLRFGRYSLAALIIHESAHATLWFPGDVNFNESFASFVESEGAKQLFRERGDLAQLRAIEIARQERRQWRELHQAMALQLQALYAGAGSEQSKRSEKHRLIGEFHGRASQLRDSFQLIRPRLAEPAELNNAYFLGFLRYYSGAEYFSGEFEGCARDWPCFFERMGRLRNLPPDERRKLLDLTQRRNLPPRD